MGNLRCDAGGINPSGIYAYPDKVTAWVKCPLSAAEYAWVKERCGYVDLRRNGDLVKMRDRWVRIWFPDPSYRQRVQMCQPSKELLEWFAHRNDVHMSYVELSLDWVFDDGESRADAYRFARRHHVKRHHRDQGIRFFQGEGGVTRYSGPRGAPNVLAIYYDKPSRVTGEVYCVHHDWRMKGAALRRASIASVRDLLELDYHKFWADRLLLRSLLVSRLGRAHQNWFRRTARRSPWIVRQGRFTYDVDRRVGSTIVRTLGSTQAVLDKFSRRFDMRRCLVPIDVSHLLPMETPAL